MMQRRLLVSLCLSGLGLSALADHAVRQGTNRQLDGWTVGSFTLNDHHGREFTEQRLQGLWTFVLFGDTTACAQACSEALTALASLCRRIAGADAMKTTQVVFISLDPQRDTPARLRDYLAAFDSRFIGATGLPATLQGLADDLGAGVTLSSVNAHGPVPHYRGSLLLIGPDATIRAEYLVPLEVPRLTAAYLRARRGRL